MIIAKIYFLLVQIIDLEVHVFWQEAPQLKPDILYCGIPHCNSLRCHRLDHRIQPVLHSNPLSVYSPQHVYTLYCGDVEAEPIQLAASLPQMEMFHIFPSRIFYIGL